MNLNSFFSSVSARRVSICALWLLVFVTSPTSRPQGLSGISGTVADPSGAVVPDAAVTVTNDATGVSSRTTTSSAGTYIITDLIPGTYTIKVEKAGFSIALQKGIKVDVSRFSSVDIALKAGTASETVEVIGEPIGLETTQPQLGTVIENKLVLEIPVLIGGGPGNIG